MEMDQSNKNFLLVAESDDELVVVMMMMMMIGGGSDDHGSVDVDDVVFSSCGSLITSALTLF